MRIAIIGPGTRFLSGIAYYTRFLAEALSQSHEVIFVPIDPLAPRWMFPGELETRRLLDLQLGNGETFRRLPPVNYRSPGSWRRTRSQLSREEPDVLILQWWTSVVGHIYWSLVDTHDPLPFVLDVHEVLDPRESHYWILRFYARNIIRPLARSAAGVIAHSRTMGTRFAAEYRFAVDRLRIVPHGLYSHVPRFPHEEAKERLNLQDSTIVLFAGLIREHKGLSILLRAVDLWADVDAAGVKLLVVGELWDRGASWLDLLARLEARGVARHRFEYVSDEELGLYMSAADVLVLPYMRDSVSGIAHVAMAHGVRIIASDLPSLRETMEDYPGISFVPPNDPSALLEALRAHASQPTSLHPPPKRTWDVVARLYGRALEDLLRERRVSAPSA